MTPLSAERNTVVICSSRADERYLKQLLLHLQPLSQKVLLETWDETRTASPAWQKEIEDALQAARLVLLLTSPNFRASRFMVTNQLPPLLEDAKREGALIFRVILSPSAFEAEDTRLERFQAINDSFEPVITMTLLEQDGLWELLADLVSDVFHLKGRALMRGEPPSSPPGAAPHYAAPAIMEPFSEGPAMSVAQAEPESPASAEPLVAGSSDDSWAGRAAAPEPVLRRMRPPLPAGSSDAPQGRPPAVQPVLASPEAAFDQPREAGAAQRAPVESLGFRAVYPQEVAVETWNTLVVYTHIASALGQVQADAATFRQELGKRAREASSEAVRPLKRGAELTMVPQGQGLAFNPATITFTWLEDWQKASFRFQAQRALAGLAVNAEITVYAGPLILAVIKMPLFCAGQALGEAASVPDAQATARAYEHIFTSYSHTDTEVVLACRNVYQSLGFNVLIDMDSLRAGQDFNRALMRLIETSDIFQLFWSRRSAESAYVRQEWEYALAHGKGEGFIRPVYWELPLVPPPEPLANFHFKYIELPRLASAVNVYEPPQREPPREINCFRCGAKNPPGTRLCTECTYDLSGQRAQHDRFLGPAGRPTYARVSMLNGPLTGRHFTLHQDTTTIGRIAGNDVVIADPTVSRSHALLRFEADHWLVEDRGSHNGTFVDGTRISGPQPLSDGAQLRFGEVRVVFQVIS